MGSIIIFFEPQFETPVCHYSDKHKDIYGDNRTELGLPLSRAKIINSNKEVQDGGNLVEQQHIKRLMILVDSESVICLQKTHSRL